MYIPKTTDLNNCPYVIVGISHAGKSEHLDKLYAIAMNALHKNNIKHWQPSITDTEWRIRLNNAEEASKAAACLMKHHTYLDVGSNNVELFIIPETNDARCRQHAICIGARPPAPNDLTSCEDVYLQQFLPDHSLPLTRLIHTVATVAGTALACYGAYSGNWLCIPFGILAIFEAGVHSHLLVEKNVPSSQYPLQVAYSDLRITFQTLLDPFTKGMQKDLAKAGIIPPPDEEEKEPAVRKSKAVPFFDLS